MAGMLGVCSTGEAPISSTTKATTYPGYYELKGRFGSGATTVKSSGNRLGRVQTGKVARGL